MSGRSEKSIPSPGGAAVLAVSPLPTDRVRLREILSQGNWKVNEASDCSEALALLRGQSVPVLLCERDHADGNWEDLLKADQTGAARTMLQNRRTFGVEKSADSLDYHGQHGNAAKSIWKGRNVSHV